MTNHEENKHLTCFVCDKNLWPFPVYNDIYCSQDCIDKYNNRKRRYCAECKNEITGGFSMCDNGCGYYTCRNCKTRKHKCKDFEFEKKRIAARLSRENGKETPENETTQVFAYNCCGCGVAK
jgi:hypothetical protein